MYATFCDFLVIEDMVETLLMLEVLFTQDSEVEHLFLIAPPGFEPSLVFSS